MNVWHIYSYIRHPLYGERRRVGHTYLQCTSVIHIEGLLCSIRSILRIKIGASIIDENIDFPIATRDGFGERLHTLMIVDF